jgi:K(+)-stimulated pyrophosphate-energized sodium pump
VFESSGTSHSLLGFSFLMGAICSGLAGFIGMKVATKANVRTTNAAQNSLGEALNIAFSGGTVMGLGVVGLGMLGLTGLYIFYESIFPAWSLVQRLEVLTGFSFGASSIALFARVGGGIYTKAADVGADLVGKVEAGIPEDHPLNPATIADNVGDNVGDVAGMGADLFESYVGSIIATMVLGSAIIAYKVDDMLINKFTDNEGMSFIMLPLILAAAGILCSIVGTFFVKVSGGGSPHKALNFTKNVPTIEHKIPAAARISGSIIKLIPSLSVNLFISISSTLYAIMAEPKTIVAIIDPTYDSNKSAPIPATSPTLSPTLSAIVAGFKG